MAERTHKNKPTESAPERDVVEVPSGSDSGQQLRDELDSLLDEIDEVLEENAEDFVRSYVQKGGQ